MPVRVRKVLYERVCQNPGAGELGVWGLTSAHHLSGVPVLGARMILRNECHRRGSLRGAAPGAGRTAIVLAGLLDLACAVVLGLVGAGAGDSRDISAGCLASQLAARGNGAGPSKELAVAKALLACQETLVAVWIGAVAAQALAAAVVAALGGRGDVGHGGFRLSASQGVSAVTGPCAGVMLDETVDWRESLAYHGHDDGFFAPVGYAGDFVSSDFVAEFVSHILVRQSLSSHACAVATSPG